ncbi:MAG: hypothetical protein ACYTFY_23135, partial [Planctomycetota bacterium]
HKSKKKKSAVVRIELPEEIKQKLAVNERNDRNNIQMCREINCVRIDYAHADEFCKAVKPQKIIVEKLNTPAEIDKLIEISAADIVLSIPAVFYESEIKNIEKLITQAFKAGLQVEANSWSGLFLAGKHGGSIAGGPGMAVLNSYAAYALHQLGVNSVKLSLEADKGKMEDFSANCRVPYSITVYGRPVLMSSRAEPGWSFKYNKPLEDSRNNRIVAAKHRGITEVRPEKPFNLTMIRNNRIKAAYFEADLTSSEHPVEEWFTDISSHESRKKPFFYNYNRKLY